MTDAYFDTSALVKLLVVEAGTPEALDAWNESTSVFMSRIAEAEVPAALAAAGRNHRLTGTGLISTLRRWESLRAGMRLVEVESSVCAAAARLAVRHPLAGADAIHLASALSILGPTDVLVVWDRRLRDGAMAEGLAVAPGAGQIPDPSG